MDKSSEALKHFIMAYYKNVSMEVLKSSIDKIGWDEFTQLLVNNGIIAFAYNAVATGCIALKPPYQVLAKWKHYAVSVAAANNIYEVSSAKIFDALNRSEIRYVLVKGFSLMDKLYGSRSIRPVLDIDIMVNPEDFLKAKTVIEGLGYKYNPGLEFAVFKDRAFEVEEECNNELSFMCKKGAVEINIDLHKYINRYFESDKINRIFPVKEIPWFEDIIYEDINGVLVPCMKIEKEFLFSLFHYILHHMLEGIKWLLDICQYVDARGLNIDFTDVLEKLKDDNLRKLVGIALYLYTYITGKSDAFDNALKNCLIKKPGIIEGYIYKTVLFKKRNIKKRYTVFILLPSTFKNRLEIIYYLLFDNSASIEGKSTGKGRGPIKNIFYVMKRIFKSQ